MSPVRIGRATNLRRLLGVAEEIGAGENRAVQSATDRDLMLRRGTLSRLGDGSYVPRMVLATQPVDPQLARWIAMRRPSVSLPPGMWTPGWLMHRMLTRGDALRASAPASRSDWTASDHRFHADEAAPASSGSGAEPKMPDGWADVLPELKAVYWYVRLFNGDPLVLVETAQALVSRASANALVDEGAGETTTVASSIALPEVVPVVVQRRGGRVTAELRGGGDSKRAARRGRRRGPAWVVEQQLVDDLVAGIVDIHAPRTVIAAHARVLLAARGFSFQVDYSRPALDCVVRSALGAAMVRVRTRA